MHSPGRPAQPFLCVVCLCLVSLLSAATVAAQVPVSLEQVDQPDAWRPHQAALAEMGEGFLVWESNRSGSWRIYTMSLDGTGMRCLTDDPDTIDHAAPQISPDGRWISYLAYQKPDNAYNKRPDGNRAELRLIRPDGSGARVLVPRARAYYENRAVTWLTPNRLAFIDHEGFTATIDLDDPTPVRISATGQRTFGYLPDPTLRYATTGSPNFATFDADTGRIQPRTQLPGCQPSFCRDGRWGYWTAGAGGPIRRIDLQTQAASTIIDKHDPRLPRSQSYLYFPMLSACDRLFAFAGSSDQHDHFRGNYDIFVAPIDPQTLELTGSPVRYTFESTTDRYPDVFLFPLQLGNITAKAPHTVTLTAPADPPADWTWTVNDQTVTRGDRLIHRFTKPGTYQITAANGTQTLRGRVEIKPASPPRIEAALLTGRQTIAVRFAEPVTLAQNTEIKLKPESEIDSLRLTPDGSTLEIQLRQPLTQAASLLLSGITDRAQQPNLLPPTTLNIEPVAWPASRDHLVFLWQQAGSPNLVDDPDADGQRSFNLARSGLAVIDSEGRLRFEHGAADFEDAGPIISRAVRATNALTVELSFKALTDDARGPARILTLSRDTGQRNLTIGQERDRLVLRLRTSQTNDNGLPQIDLGPIQPGSDRHLLLTFKQGRLNVWLDGQPALRNHNIGGDLGQWQEMPLRLGDEQRGGREWTGILHRIAVYNHAWPENLARLAHYAAAADRQRAGIRHPVTVEVTVQAVSDRPTLQQINPYREALRLDEVTVDRVIEGTLDEKSLRIARWAILDGKPLDAPKVGDRLRLTIEPWEHNPQLIATFLQDTLEDDFFTPQFVAISPALDVQPAEPKAAAD